MSSPAGRVLQQPPGAYTTAQLRTFEALVREAFDGSDDGLPARIRSAKQLAFHYEVDDAPTAIAGLKTPSAGERSDTFARAGSTAAAGAFDLELGWVFVAPARRRRGIGELLCRRLLESEPRSRFFATTRPDNRPMIRILSSLGFERSGHAFAHTRRAERLILFLARDRV